MTEVSKPESSANMKLILALLVMVLVVDAQAQWYKFTRDAIGGAKDMWRAYEDMKEANWIDADKYFHARGNYEAANRGPGGKWAAEVISDAREALQVLSSSGHSDSEEDQEANRWGREGHELSCYRPEDLPDKY